MRRCRMARRCLRPTQASLSKPFRGRLWAPVGPLTQFDPCVTTSRRPDRERADSFPVRAFIRTFGVCRLDQEARMVSVSASQNITLFCRSDSTPILMATIVDAPRSTLQACSSPRRMASRKLPM